MPIFFLAGFIFKSSGQQVTPMNTRKFINVSVAAGFSQATLSGSFAGKWRVAKNKKWNVGLGLRVTLFDGHNNEFYIAPARLTRSSSIPFVIILARQETQNIGTLTVGSPLVFSVNAFAEMDYQFSVHWSGGINIDLIGFSFSSATLSMLQSNGHFLADRHTKPSGFNLLLTGANDKGSLNPEFFIRYSIGRQRPFTNITLQDMIYKI